jgi:predicted permease
MLKRIFQRRNLYNDFSEELRQHLEERTEQIMRTENLPRNEAEQAARKAFGNATLIEQQGRETWQWPRMENLLRDISFSIRLLRKSPSFTLIAILTLTLGVGANTAVFSLLNGLLLRPLPVPNAQQLVLLRLDPIATMYSFCYPIFNALEAKHDVFSSIFAFTNRPMQVRGPNGNEEVLGSLVSGQYFDALATPAEIGRTLNSSDDRKGANSNPVVITDSLWKTRYSHVPDILGRQLIVSNVSFTIVGVMPKNFIGADSGFRPQFYLPLSTEPLVDVPYNNFDGGYHSWWLRVGARLKPNVSLVQANAFLKSVGPSILKETIPDPNFSFGATKRNGLDIAAESGAAGFSTLRNRYRNPLLVTFVLCIAVLLLACINLASLLLARAAAREREIATRLAIGASRTRLIQQLLVDSLLLAILGTAAGLATAPVVSHQLVNMLAPANTHLTLDASIDWRVFLFAAVAAIASTLLIGLLPAMQATAGDLNQHMKDGARSTRIEHRRILPKVLLTVEVTIAMILVTGAGLLATSLIRLYRSGLGFDPHNLLLASYDMSKLQQLDEPARLRLLQSISERVSQQSGVASVTFSGNAPLSGDIWIQDFHTPGGMDRATYRNSIGPDYFRTLHIPMFAGREFRWQDTPETGQKIVLNEAAAKMFFPNSNAVGQQIRQKEDNKETSYEVIAVVGNTKYTTIRDSAPPTAYAAMTQGGKPSYYTAVVRFSGPVAPLASAIRRITTELAPDMPAPAFDNMEQQIDDNIAAERVMAMLSVFFAISALLVTAIGLYGVLAYTTARRTSEIGIRMALGAARTQVVALIFKENIWVAAAGAIAGLITTLLASRALATFLYGTSPRDPWVMIASLTALSLIAAAASLIPAIRAASIDPMKALRSE